MDFRQLPFSGQTSEYNPSHVTLEESGNDLNGH